MRLILASASPRRAELLKAAGFSFEVRPVDIDESIRPGEPAEQYVRRLAEEKALVASGFSRTDVLVLGADTSVVINDEILGKPCDPVDARAMLKRLAGRRHEVLTGVSLRHGNVQQSRVEQTAVFFAPLGDEEIDWYVQSGEGCDKAGAYAIQGLASRFVTRIEGSYSNVVGLPVAVVYELIRPIWRPVSS